MTLKHKPPLARHPHDSAIGQRQGPRQTRHNPRENRAYNRGALTAAQRLAPPLAAPTLTGIHWSTQNPYPASAP